MGIVACTKTLWRVGVGFVLGVALGASDNTRLGDSVVLGVALGTSDTSLGDKLGFIDEVDPVLGREEGKKCDGAKEGESDGHFPQVNGQWCVAMGDLVHLTGFSATHSQFFSPVLVTNGFELSTQRQLSHVRGQFVSAPA